jgi:hypothetical protein
MKKLFALSMLISCVAPACADDNTAQTTAHPMEEYRVEQLKKDFNAKDGTTWYLHHRQYDPKLENGICVENCDGVVEVAGPVPPHKFSRGSGITDMLAGAKCITIPPSGCDAIWTAKRHAKKAAYHAPVCR